MHTLHVYHKNGFYNKDRSEDERYDRIELKTTKNLYKQFYEINKRHHRRGPFMLPWRVLVWDSGISTEIILDRKKIFKMEQRLAKEYDPYEFWPPQKVDRGTLHIGQYVEVKTRNSKTKQKKKLFKAGIVTALNRKSKTARVHLLYKGYVFRDFNNVYKLNTVAFGGVPHGDPIEDANFLLKKSNLPLLPQHTL